MEEKTWNKVDAYFRGLFAEEDVALRSALEESGKAGLPAINVTPTQGKMLHLLARAVGARRILEIGTLGGYSTIWMARAIPPDGKLMTLELNSAHADVALANIRRAGLERLVEIRRGGAAGTLRQLVAEKCQPFDFIFIDADKPGYEMYLEYAMRLSRSGTLIVADNVVRNGAVADAESENEAVQGIRRFNARVSTEKRVSATAIQTVGEKGYDGFLIALVN